LSRTKTLLLTLVFLVHHITLHAAEIPAKPQGDQKSAADQKHPDGEQSPPAGVRYNNDDLPKPAPVTHD
jgi:hypothetical protein